MYRMGIEEAKEVEKVILSKQLLRVGDPKAGHLQEVVRFEQEWANKIGTAHALMMCGGGTAALICSLAGIGVGPGDEVIVPAYTWMATATSVLMVGGIPVLADVDESMALDPVDLERRIGPSTRAVIPVHMLGRPADMERIMAVARKHGLKVVEDSCQMVGGSYKGRRTGSWGDAGAFSFNFYKIISTGEGGAMTTSDRSIYERACMFADSGAAFRAADYGLSTPVFVAQQYRANEIMGAMGRIQMQRMDGIIADLRRNRKRIEAELKGAEGIQIAPSNDPEGDCGVVVAFQFESEEKARAFKGCPGVGGYVGIDHGKHVFREWTPVREKRIMHHPAMNPFNFPQNRDLRADYSDSACPRSLDLLRRTVFVSISPEWSEADVQGKIESLRSAGRKVS
ncbi:MAG: DegT/DnrJ/EryC1/StrS family aminotransferase [Planctomycetota bacterium]